MREAATLRLDSGREIRVDVDVDTLADETIVVRRPESATEPKSAAEFLAAVDHHLATVTPRPDGTTDRWLENDRARPY
jgi:hypothetical protein